MRASAPRLGALAGLQFLAALHILLFYEAPQHLAGAPVAVVNILGAGYASVSLLFVLTGFLTAYGWLRLTDGAAVDKRAFWSGRIARIYPIYAIGIVLSLAPIALTLLAPDAEPLDFKAIAMRVALSATFLQAWVPQTACTPNCTGSAVSDAVLFFLLFPIVVPLVRRLRGRALLVAAAALWVLSLLAFLAGTGFIERVVAPGPARLLWFNGLTFQPLFRLPEFFIGVLLGKYYLEERDAGVWSRFAVPIAVGALVALVLVMSIGPVLPALLHRTSLLAPLSAALILALAGTPQSAVPSNPVLVRLGAASFSLFLLQLPLHDLLRQAGVLTGRTLHRGPTWLPAFIAVAIVVALLAHFLVEEPLRQRILTRLMPPKRERVPLIVGQPWVVDAMEGEGAWEAEQALLARVAARKAERRNTPSRGGFSASGSAMPSPDRARDATTPT